MSDSENTPKKRINIKKILIHIAVIASVTAMLIVGFIFWLNYYTNHGNSFSVPNFKGLTLQEAEKILKAKKLRVVVLDSIYAPTGKPGAIIEQNPPADFKVKENRRVFVTINTVNPKMIEMPDFRDMTFVQAKADMASYGLKLGKITYKPSKFDNMVLEQEYNNEVIEAGTKIPKYSSIDLILGESKNMLDSPTPYLIGLTQEQAQLILTESNLNLGTVLFDKTVKTYADSINAMIQKQFPLPNTLLNPGDEVDLWMSMTPPDTLI